ncbi:hypothetical protein GCM10012275_13110 [Longimycelium tulufanense]|uniref:t-SNARE coiled-coil homology domain-containing protein n=1 Tax=Longimycelium tulufanense TaxID=907463 RepID=A0A8J3CBK3_9PSEU|nr:hypothetical protein [Longimycelium tulufanense]GGM43527.1 hypothetical protein GCM10012275_13110 [Longimycelium tulufanense]
MAVDELERQVRSLRVEHAETRWLSLRVDNDVKELRDDMRQVRSTLDEHTRRFDSLDGRLDSVDAQMRSLTQMVGEVLRRLPEPEQSDD